MLRTIIQQKDSFTLTLPKEWILRNKLKNKDSLRVSEDDFSGDLIVSTLRQTVRTKVELDMGSFDSWDAIVSINQAHRLGYDSIVCYHVDQSIVKDIERFVQQTLMGFHLERRRSSLVIESLVSDALDESKIEHLLRKLFTITAQTFEEKDTRSLRVNMDNYANHLRRTIIKFNYAGKQAFQYVSLIDRLVKIQHAIRKYRKIEQSSVLKKLHEYFMQLEHAFWKKDIKALAQLNDTSAIIEPFIEEHVKKSTAGAKYLYEILHGISLCFPVAAALQMG